MSGTVELPNLSLLVRRGVEGPYLVGGRCISCGEILFPIQAICPCCTGQEIAQLPLSRKGRLHTYSIVYQKPPDYTGTTPYIMGKLLLPENVFVLSQLDLPEEDIKVGMEMEVVIAPIFTDANDNAVLGYKFRPVAN